MITLAIYDKHRCINPALAIKTRRLEPGSLWECDEWGREAMLIKKSFRGDTLDEWLPTVEIIKKTKGKK